jgi:hypothetical protein
MPPFLIVIIPLQATKGGKAGGILQLRQTRYVLTGIGMYQDNPRHWYAAIIRNGAVFKCSDSTIKKTSLEDLQTIHRGRIFLFQKENTVFTAESSATMSSSAPAGKTSRDILKLYQAIYEKMDLVTQTLVPTSSPVVPTRKSVQYFLKPC